MGTVVQVVQALEIDKQQIAKVFARGHGAGEVKEEMLMQTAHAESKRHRQIDPVLIAHRDKIDRVKYFDRRVADKIAELKKEERTQDETRLHAKAAQIIESEMRAIPNNPTLEEIASAKASAGGRPFKTKE